MPPKPSIHPILAYVNDKKWADLCLYANQPENQAEIAQSSAAALAILTAAMDYKNTPSTQAAISLLNAGALPSGAVDSEGAHSALHWAILNANHPLALELARCDPSLLWRRNKEHLTPLHLAIQKIISETYYTTLEIKATVRQMVIDIVKACPETEYNQFGHGEGLLLAIKNTEFAIATALLQAGAATDDCSKVEYPQGTALDFVLNWYKIHSAETPAIETSAEKMADCKTLISRLLGKEAPALPPLSAEFFSLNDWFLIDTYLTLLNYSHRTLPLVEVGPLLARVLTEKRHSTKALLLTMYEKRYEEIAQQPVFLGAEEPFSWSTQPCGADNWSLAHFVADAGDIVCVEFLLRRGVDFFNKSGANDTPVALAKKHGHLNILAAAFAYFPCHRTYETCFSDRAYDIVIFAQNKPDLMFALLTSGIELVKKNEHKQTVESLLLSDAYESHLFPVLYNIFSTYRTRGDETDQRKTKEQFDDFKKLCAAIDPVNGTIHTATYQPVRFMHSIRVLGFFNAGTGQETHYTIFRNKIIALEPAKRIAFLRDFAARLNHLLARAPDNFLAHDMLTALAPAMIIPQAAPAGALTTQQAAEAIYGNGAGAYYPLAAAQFKHS